MIASNNHTSTICAIATPAGGAISVVRVSGPEAINATARIFVPAGTRSITEKQGGTLTFGRIVDPVNGETVDEVLVSLFRTPHSYTGEDCTEISCHGSSYIQTRVVQLLIAQGCVMAQPGEYTQRAFLNGKMDLSQAEAVADLIASTTAANHRMAMQQMRGGFSKRLKDLREQLLKLTSLMELELDFSDHEDLEFASRTELYDLAQNVRAQIDRLCRSFSLGNALKRGFPVAIVGETNAGKSTLLNALVGEQRALVSHIHGTTRDTVEESIMLGDTLIRFIDTAGIRATDDAVEQMGIERTYEKIDEADIVIWMLDATNALAQYRALKDKVLCPDKHYLIVLNKTDLISDKELQDIQAQLRSEIGSVSQAETRKRKKPDLGADCATESLSQTETGNNSQTETGNNDNDTANGFAGKTSRTVKEADSVTASVKLLGISAHEELHIEYLTHALEQTLSTLRGTVGNEADVIVSNARHYEALNHAGLSLDRVIEGLRSGLSGDFISQDLRECLYYLGSIIGEIPVESVLHSIFKNFCIGK